MKQLVYINACIRGAESRTRKLAEAMLHELAQRYEITEIDLSNYDPGCVTEDIFKRRQQIGLPEDDLRYGNKIATADLIVVAAPFWDMSFPAVLKAFIEHMCAPGLTFKYNPDGSNQGICRAEKMLYITTRGGLTKTGSRLDQGTSYLKAICWLWGIPQVKTFAVTGTDMCTPEELAEIMAKATEKGRTLCRKL
jgi:FMN-dependent NADH-azoreductase